MLGIKLNKKKVPWYIEIPLLAVATWQSAYWVAEQEYKALSAISGLESTVQTSQIDTNEPNNVKYSINVSDNYENEK